MSDSREEFAGMFQDAAGTIPVTKSGDPVGLVVSPASIENITFESAVKQKWPGNYGFGLSKRTGDYLDIGLQGMFWAWQASRQALPSCPEIPDSPATGNAVAMGDLADEDGNLHKKTILIEFASVEDFHAARSSGQCRFTVFGGSV